MNVQEGGGGAFFKLMTSRGQCPRGGVALGVPPIQVQTPLTWLAGYGPGTPYLYIKLFNTIDHFIYL